jgi:hypothetical protein
MCVVFIETNPMMQRFPQSTKLYRKCNPLKFWMDEISHIQIMDEKIPKWMKILKYLVVWL